MSIFLSFISRIFIILTSFVPCCGRGMVDQKITFNLVLIWKLESRPEDERNKTNHNCRSYYMSELKFYRNLKHKSPPPPTKRVFIAFLKSFWLLLFNRKPGRWWCLYTGSDTTFAVCVHCFSWTLLLPWQCTCINDGQ